VAARSGFLALLLDELLPEVLGHIEGDLESPVRAGVLWLLDLAHLTSTVFHKCVLDGT